MSRKARFLIFTLLCALLTACSKPTAPAGPQDGSLVLEETVPVDPEFQGKLEYERITYLSNGVKVKGFLIKPAGTTNQKYPVLIFNHGGNSDKAKLEIKHIKEKGLADFALSGFVVLAPQYGFADGGEGKEEFGGQDVNDVLNIAKVADDLPYAQPKQKVMFGISRGGMMTYLAMKNGVDIRAAVIQAGPVDMLALIQERPDMKPLLAGLIGNAQTQPELYEQRSAINWVDKLRVPLLLLHGDADVSVNISHSQRMIAELDKGRVEHDLKVFPGGDHSLKNFLPERNRVSVEWFQRYLNM
jgi:dipeptidyl aminopeptidase/acylaminoacyl peptidase